MELLLHGPNVTEVQVYVHNLALAFDNRVFVTYLKSYCHHTLNLRTFEF